MLIRLVTMIGCCVLSGCVYVPSQPIQGIRELSEQVPTSCRFLGEVQGESHFSFLALGEELARSRAKDKAALLGATHVVWMQREAGWVHLTVARAYRCPARAG